MGWASGTGGLDGVGERDNEEGGTGELDGVGRRYRWAGLGGRIVVSRSFRFHYGRLGSSNVMILQRRDIKKEKTKKTSFVSWSLVGKD